MGEDIGSFNEVRFMVFLSSLTASFQAEESSPLFSRCTEELHSDTPDPLKLLLHRALVGQGASEPAAPGEGLEALL